MTPETPAVLLHEVLTAVEAKLHSEFAAMRASNAELAGVLRDLVTVLSAPVTRESVINLPSGPVKMTVKEH